MVKQTGYIVDGLALADGMRVVFAADTDPIVKNKIYDVNFVTAGDSTQVINLDRGIRRHTNRQRFHIHRVRHDEPRQDIPL